MSDEEQSLPELSGATHTRGEIAYMMKRRGMSLSDIGAELNASPYQVNQMIRERFDHEIQEQTPEQRQTILQLEMDRLEYYLSKLWPEIEYGDPKAITAALAVHDRVMKVNRLDTPDAATGQATILVVGGEEQSYIEALKKMNDG